MKAHVLEIKARDKQPNEKATQGWDTEVTLDGKPFACSKVTLTCERGSRYAKAVIEMFVDADVALSVQIEKQAENKVDP